LSNDGAQTFAKSGNQQEELNLLVAIYIGTKG
jgi:hypothetical protein